MEHVGRRLYGLAAVGFGVSYLVRADFATAWQPVPADAPLRWLLVDVAAAAMLIAGVGLLIKRSLALAGFTLAFIYAAFAILWIERVMVAPLTEEAWGSFAEEFALVLAGLIVCNTVAPIDSRTIAMRVGFGLCAIIFGLTHFANLTATAAFVPNWFPGNGLFWAYATGFAHAAGGLALIVGYRPRLAARGLTAMFIGFGLLVWLPKLAMAPANQMAWSGNIVNLALIASAWIVADSPLPSN